MFELGNIMRQAQEMQTKIAKMQEDLGNRKVAGASGGGMVTAVCNGNQEILSIAIDKTVVDPEDVTMLEDLVLTAVNDALRQSREMMAQEMRSITGGLGIPGLF